MLVRAVSVALVSTVLGCQPGAGSQPCRIESEFVLTQTPTAARAVSVTAVPNGFYAAWSTEEGIFVSLLDDRGYPTAQPYEVFLGRPWPDVAAGSRALWSTPPGSGIAAEVLSLVATTDGAALVALVPGERGAVYLWQLTASGPGPSLRLGAAGPNATGVDIARTASGSLLATWHRGADDTSDIELSAASPQNTGLESVAHARLARTNPAFSPSIAAGPRAALLAWAELDRGSPPVVLVHTAAVYQDLSIGPVHVVGRGSYLHPTVDVLASEQGFGLVFRDDADDDDTPEYYYVSLAADGSPLSVPARISKADGFTGPHLARDGELWTAAAIRSYERNLLIGMNRFDTRGRKVGGELQIYADKSDFVRVDVARGTSGLLLLYSEDRDDHGRVISSRVGCRP